MAALDMHKSPRCQHVHYTGKPCKAPARRGRNYCVFHQAAHLDPGGCVLPIIEDLHSYQIAVIRIMQSLAADAIDSKKATALLYALQLLGGKLNDFAKQREEVENPATALKKEIEQRYEARKPPFPSWIPEEEVLAILKEIRAEQPSELGEDIEIIPQPKTAFIPSDDAGSPAVGEHAASESRNLHGSEHAPGAAVPSAPDEFSPAVHCRVSDAPTAPSAVGTTETSPDKSSVPTGLNHQDGRVPGVETPGYRLSVPPGRSDSVPQGRPAGSPARTDGFHTPPSPGPIRNTKYEIRNTKPIAPSSDSPPQELGRSA